MKRRHSEEGSRFVSSIVKSQTSPFSVLDRNRHRSKPAQGAVDFEIKDSFVLESLGLKDECSEAELEVALILKLEQFFLSWATTLLSLRAKGDRGCVPNRTAWLCSSSIGRLRC